MNRLHTASRTTGKKLMIAALGLMSFAGVAVADVNVDIRIGAPPPPPPRHVVVRETVVVDDGYVVGHRRAIYDADLRLRLAQAEQYRAANELETARKRESEIAQAVDDQEAVVVQLRRDGDAPPPLPPQPRNDVRLEQARRDVASARAAVEDAERRASRAKTALDDVRRQGEPDFNAFGAYQTARQDLESTRANLDQAVGRLERAGADTVPAQDIPQPDNRRRLRDAEDRLARMRDDLAAAHEDVYVARRRLAEASEAVYAAVHDRDEAMWLCHRDRILAGEATFENCGFSVDIAFIRAHRHEPEVIHAHFVRPVDYWRARPVEVSRRVVEVDRVTEITRIREVQRVREPERVRHVERFEAGVVVDDRHRVAAFIAVEHDTYSKERRERETAAREGRKPQTTQFVSRPSRATNVTNVTNVTNITNVTNVSNTKNTTSNTTNVTNTGSTGSQRTAPPTVTPNTTTHGRTLTTTPPTSTGVPVVNTSGAKSGRTLGSRTVDDTPAPTGKSGKTLGSRTIDDTPAPTGKSGKTLGSRTIDDTSAPTGKSGKTLGSRTVDDTPAPTGKSGKTLGSRTVDDTPTLAGRHGATSQPVREGKSNGRDSRDPR